MTDALREALQELVDADDALAAHQARGYMVGDAWDFDDTQRRLSARRAEARTAARTALQEPAPVVAREPFTLEDRVLAPHAEKAISAEFRRMRATGCQEWAHKSGWTVIATSELKKLRAQAPVEPAPDSYAIALHSDGTTTDMRACEGYEAGKAAAPSQLVEDARQLQELSQLCFDKGKLTGRHDAIAECLRAAMGVSVTDDSRRTADRIYVAIRAVDAKGVES